jgi:hypothetical protein
MRIQIAQIAPQLLKQRIDHFMHDSSMPLTVRGMLSVHMSTPWIPNFWTVGIRAPKPGSEMYFDFPLGVADDNTSWFFPAQEWWIAHATASHPPAGRGCDPAVHTKFLSREGTAHEFDYAAILRDGTLKILGPADFQTECAWWSRAFGA